jgi:hypothetical protein
MKTTIEMAREAHKELVTKDYPGHMGQLDQWTLQLLKRFEALVRADERAKLQPKKIKSGGKDNYCYGDERYYANE